VYGKKLGTVYIISHPKAIMQERIPTAGVLLYEGSKVLLVEHTKYANLPTGPHGFPAGRI
jgi:hypothetical protein